MRSVTTLRPQDQPAAPALLLKAEKTPVGPFLRSSPYDPQPYDPQP